jgi:hypothetical protein
MKLDLSRNIDFDATLPIGPVRVFSASVLTLELKGIPAKRGGKRVDGVLVSVTNADGMLVTANAVKIGAIWFVRFAASNFANYGVVENGVAVALVYDDEPRECIGRGQFEVVAASAEAKPGTPTAAYVSKGDELYVKANVVDGVQHYLLQSMVYDAEMEAWGAEWTGDYILVDGEFVAANATENA